MLYHFCLMFYNVYYKLVLYAFWHINPLTNLVLHIMLQVYTGAIKSHVHSQSTKHNEPYAGVYVSDFTIP